MEYALSIDNNNMKIIKFYITLLIKIGNEKKAEQFFLNKIKLEPKNASK